MSKFSSYIRGVYNVYCREFKLVLSDVGIILFFIFLPLAYPVVYSLIYNPELVKKVPMVVVDNDRTPVSRELVRELDACDQVRIAGYAANLDEARRAMAGKDVFSILEIPVGMERKVGRRETAPAVLYTDMTLLLRYRGFLVAATNVMQNMGAELMTEDINEIAPLAETIAVGDLMPINNINMGNIRGGFDSFIMPAIVILILCQCIVLASGMAGGAKREAMRLTGYDANNTMPSVFGTMMGQSLCYITIIALPAVFLIHYVPLIFSFPMAGNLLEELAFIVPIIIGCLGMGFVFQGVVTERESVFVSWVITSVILLFLSGIIWPRYAMHRVWYWFGAIFPSTWGVEGFVRMNSNGATLAQVSTEYLWLWGLAVVWTLLGWLVQKYIVRPSRHKHQFPLPTT